MPILKKIIWEKSYTTALLDNQWETTKKLASRKGKRQFEKILERELVNGIELYLSNSYMTLLRGYTYEKIFNEFRVFNYSIFVILGHPIFGSNEKRRVFRRVFENDTLEDFARLYKLIKIRHSNRYSWEAIQSLAQNLLNESHHPITRLYIENFIKKHQINKRLTTGQPAPNFSLPDTSLQQIQLSQFRGKYVLLDFWATSCKWCLISMKNFSELKEKYGENLEIISISTDKTFEVMKDFVSKHNYNWVFVYGGFRGETSINYDVSFYPTYYLIDPNGNFVTDGKIRLNQIDKFIK